MTRKRRRLIVVIVGMACLGLATILILLALNASGGLLYFTGPSEIAENSIPAGRHVRIGGLVEDGSVEKASDGKTVHFKITDGSHDIPVVYVGALPDLFREGQGVVADGTIEAGALRASTVLAKHDEKYMPREVVDALKKSGQ